MLSAIAKFLGLSNGSSKIPEVGEKWFLTADKSPWPKKYPPVTILDVKDGWVRYSFQSFFKDQRMKIDTFVGMYRQHD